MFNKKLKKDSIERLEESIKRYDKEIEKVKINSEKLLDIRRKGIKLIRIVETYINTIANRPKSFEKDFKEIEMIVENFKDELNKIREESERATKISGSTAGAGILAGAGVAALAPTAAMAIATTFGTASTGIAISSLSGAAATNAALAWLGGGALAAGGAGMAGGSALLALAGPIGIAIGGGALVGSALFAGKKNKKIAEEAYSKAIDVEQATRNFERINEEVVEIYSCTLEQGRGINKIYEKLLKLEKTDYNEFTNYEQYELGSLVNNTKSFARLLNRRVKQE